MASVHLSNFAYYFLGSLSFLPSLQLSKQRLSRLAPSSWPRWSVSHDCRYYNSSFLLWFDVCSSSESYWTGFYLDNWTNRRDFDFHRHYSIDQSTCDSECHACHKCRIGILVDLATSFGTRIQLCALVFELHFDCYWLSDICICDPRKMFS